MEATPLGKAEDIPVKFGEAAIPINAIITNATSYELILGNEWLRKARAVVDLNAEKMKITWKGRSWKIPININKGIRPEIEEDDQRVSDECFAVGTTRLLTEEERNQAYELMLQEPNTHFVSNEFIVPSTVALAPEPFEFRKPRPC